MRAAERQGDAERQEHREDGLRLGPPERREDAGRLQAGEERQRRVGAGLPERRVQEGSRRCPP